MTNSIPGRLVVSTVLVLASSFAPFVTPSHAQDSHQTPQIPVSVPKGYRLIVDVKFSCSWENLLVISRQFDGRREREFNSLFGGRWPVEAPAGGGTWTSEVAMETTVYYLTGQHKESGREGGGGKPWVLSDFKVFVAGASDGVVGYEDNGDKNNLNYNNLTVRYKLEKVDPSSN